FARRVDEPTRGIELENHRHVFGFLRPSNTNGHIFHDHWINDPFNLVHVDHCVRPDRHRHTPYPQPTEHQTQRQETHDHMATYNSLRLPHIAQFTRTNTSSVLTADAGS